MAGNASNEVVLAEVKIEKTPFREAFSAIQALLRENHLKVAIDPVHDILENFDNPRAFTLAKKDVALGDLLTSFCRYYGLDWKRSDDTIVFSLPRPRLQASTRYSSRPATAFVPQRVTFK